MLGAALLLSLELFLGRPQNRLTRSYARASHVPILQAGSTTIYPAYVPWDMAYGRRVFASGGKPMLPLAGISNRLTGLCSAGGKLLAFESDEFGFRNPRGSHERDAEVAVIGDSFAHGYCVSHDESVAGIVRSRFPSTLNLGVTGAGPLWELAVLREYAAAVRPPRIVWLFFEGNDLEGLGVEAGGFLKNYFDTAYTQKLRSRQNVIDRSESHRLDSLARALVNPGPERIRRALLLRETRARLGINFRPGEADVPKSGSPVSREVAILEDVLTSAQATASQWGARVLFVYLPERSRFSDADTGFVELDGHQRARRDVLNAARSAGMDVLDLLPVFASKQAPLALWDAGRIHYNAQGYRLVADAIAEALLRMDLTGKATGGKLENEENPQRQPKRAAEDYWIRVDRVKMSMVRRPYVDR